jgi:hypothetical protein
MNLNIMSIFIRTNDFYMEFAAHKFLRRPLSDLVIGVINVKSFASKLSSTMTHKYLHL